VATLFKHLRFAGVRIVTLAEGKISELHVGLKGAMNALFPKVLALKTHRVIRGAVEKGKAGGEPIRGDREIVPEEAKVIRRIFREQAVVIPTLWTRDDSSNRPSLSGHRGDIKTRDYRKRPQLLFSATRSRGCDQATLREGAAWTDSEKHRSMMRPHQSRIVGIVRT
jgi:hypothetical protein